MNDRELLELAAKAAGIKGAYGDASDDYYYKGNTAGILTELPDGQSYVWNPLTDDGDALRLAVKLNIYMMQNYDKEPHAMARVLGGVRTGYIERHGGDMYAANRRAIVRAAAEIGGVPGSTDA